MFTRYLTPPPAVEVFRFLCIKTIFLGPRNSVREEVEAGNCGLFIPFLEKGCFFRCYTTELLGETTLYKVTVGSCCLLSM